MDQAYRSIYSELPRLTPEQEAAAWIAKAQGDAQARDALICHHLLLVKSIASLYPNIKEDYEDRVSRGSIALIRAVDTFKPSKGIKFSTYAGKCIKNVMLRIYQLERRRAAHQTISLDAPIFTGKYEGMMPLSNVLAVPDDTSTAVEGKQLRVALDRAISTLKPIERRVINMRYRTPDGKVPMQNEIAVILKYHAQSSVSRIERRAADKLRAALADWHPASGQ